MNTDNGSALNNSASKPLAQPSISNFFANDYVNQQDAKYSSVYGNNIPTTTGIFNTLFSARSPRHLDALLLTVTG